MFLSKSRISRARVLQRGRENVQTLSFSFSFTFHRLSHPFITYPFIIFNNTLLTSIHSLFLLHLHLLLLRGRGGWVGARTPLFSNSRGGRRRWKHHAHPAHGTRAQARAVIKCFGKCRTKKTQGAVCASHALQRSMAHYFFIARCVPLIFECGVAHVFHKTFAPLL